MSNVQEFSHFTLVDVKTSIYKDLLLDLNFRRWLENVARGSLNTSDVYYRRMGYLCREFQTTPDRIARLSPKDVKNFALDVIGQFENAGMNGVYLNSFIKAHKSWLKFNEIVLPGSPIKVKGATDHTKYENEVVPTSEELNRILDVADIRTKVMIALIAFCGSRPEVLGNVNGTDGLKIFDLPEMKINHETRTAEFSVLPSLLIVRKAISKAGHRYFNFMPVQGCKYLKNYLEYRMNNGELLKPDSPIITAIENGAGFIVTHNISEAVRQAIRKAGYSWRPYVLRRYFEMRMQDAESERLVIRDHRLFFMGHKGEISATYSVNKGLASGGGQAKTSAGSQGSNDTTGRINRLEAITALKKVVEYLEQM